MFLITSNVSILTKVYSHREYWRLSTGWQNKDAQCHSKWHRKRSFRQKSDILQGVLQYANNHMIKCGMKSMMVRVSQVSVYYVTVCHTCRKYRNMMCMTKCCLVLGDQMKARGRRWRKTLTQKLNVHINNEMWSMSIWILSWTVRGRL